MGKALRPRNSERKVALATKRNVALADSAHHSGSMRERLTDPSGCAARCDNTASLPGRFENVDNRPHSRFKSCWAVGRATGCAAGSGVASDETFLILLLLHYFSLARTIQSCAAGCTAAGDAGCTAGRKVLTRFAQLDRRHSCSTPSTPYRARGCDLCFRRVDLTLAIDV